MLHPTAASGAPEGRSRRRGGRGGTDGLADTEGASTDPGA